MHITPKDLRSADAAALRADLAEAGPADALAHVTRLRRHFPDAAPELVSAVVTQSELARRAERRLGTWAHDMVLEATALEQATRQDVARYRAQRLVERLGTSSAPRIADLGCGIGVDARALAEAGCRVTVVDLDPWRLEAAADNAGLAGNVTAICADVRDIDLSDFDAAFVDPARRAANAPRTADGTRSAKEADPQSWSPPWSWVVSTSAQLPLATKVAPGIPLSAVPASAEVEWIDHEGDTVEACVWFAPLASARRRATVVPTGRPGDAETIDAAATPPPPIAASMMELLIEPAHAVRRAGLVDDLSARFDLSRINSASNWLTADSLAPTLLARPWAVVRELPHQPKALRAALAGRGPVTWKTADVTWSATEQDRRVSHRPVRGAEPVFAVLTADNRVIEVAPA